MTQEQIILEHLQNHEGITPKEAWQLYGVYRLSSVIHRLRKKYKIHTIMREEMGNDKVNKYADYRLEG